MLRALAPPFTRADRLRMRLLGGRLLPHPPERFQGEIALKWGRATEAQKKTRRSPDVCRFLGRRMMRVARLLWGASMAASFALWWAGARTCRWSGGILPQNGGRLRRVHIPGHWSVRRRGRVLPQLTARMHEDAGGYAKMDQCVGHQSGYQPLVSSGRAMAAVMPSTARSRS